MKNFFFLLIIISFWACKKSDDAGDQQINDLGGLKEIVVAKNLTCPPNLLYNVDQLNGFGLVVSKADKTNFEKHSKEDFIKFNRTENSDSLEQKLQKNFPGIFKKENDRYKFTTKIDKRVVFVMNKLYSDDRRNSEYKFLGSYNNLILMHLQYYEGQDYLVINTTNGEVFSFANEPRFMSEHCLFSLGENYGTVDLQVFNLKENRYLLLNFESFRQGFTLAKSYTAYQDHIFMKVNHSKEASFFIFNFQKGKL